MDDDSTIPENEEEEIPEVNTEELKNLTSSAELSGSSQDSNSNVVPPATSQNLTENVGYPQNLNNNTGLTGYPQNVVAPTFPTNYQQMNGQVPMVNQMQNFQMNQPAMINYR